MSIFDEKEKKMFKNKQMQEKGMRVDSI